jgi:hypothetical protein
MGTKEVLIVGIPHSIRAIRKLLWGPRLLVMATLDMYDDLWWLRVFQRNRVGSRRYTIISTSSVWELCKSLVQLHVSKRSSQGSARDFGSQSDPVFGRETNPKESGLLHFPLQHSSTRAWSTDYWVLTIQYSDIIYPYLLMGLEYSTVYSTVLSTEYSSTEYYM